MSKRDEFLKKQKILRLATLDKNDNPHVVPVWYLFSSKKLYIGTNSKTEKAKNIKNNNIDFNLALRKNKLLSVPADDNVIRFTPPLIISNEEVDRAISIIDQSLKELND